MNYKIGICGMDSHYSLGLMEYINMHTNIPLRCTAFSSERALTEYSEKDKFDVILLDEGMAQMSVEHIPVIRLTEDRPGDMNSGFIYKYQSVEELVRCIVEHLRTVKGISVDTQRIYAVYSPVGRCGKTRLAQGICSCYADSLYIGMEEWQHHNTAGTAGDAFAADRFIYNLLGRNPSVVDCIESYPKEPFGFRHIVCSADFMDNRQLEAGHIEWLCGLLRQQSAYKRIVFDINTASLSGMDVLGIFDKVLVPVLDDAASEKKLDMFRSLVGSGLYGLTSDSFLEINVPDAEYDSQAMRVCVEGGRI